MSKDKSKKATNLTPTLANGATPMKQDANPDHCQDFASGLSLVNDQVWVNSDKIICRCQKQLPNYYDFMWFCVLPMLDSVSSHRWLGDTLSVQDSAAEWSV